jgi:hypothetical protein
LEDQPDLALGLAHVLVEQLRTLDVEEVRTGVVVPGLLGDPLRQRVRDRLRDQRLATTRRPVQEDPLRGLQVVLVEEVGVEVRKLDRVLDHLDLVVEAADVVVRDVGDLFEDELLDLGARQPFEQHARARVHEDVVAGADLLTDQRIGELAHAFLVGASDDERAAAVFEQVLEGDDLATRFAATREHDVERLVEDDLLALLDSFEVELGVHGDAHLAARGEDVDRVVVVGAEEGAIRVGGHGELVALFAQGRDVLTRLAERRRKPFVVRDGLRELTLGLEQPLLERTHPLGCVLQPAAQDDHLFLE